MNMVSYDFTGKVAFVTGASAGMGAATARSFAEAGAAVAIVDLDGGAAERFAAELNAEGHRALAVQCDVSDEAQVENAVARTEDAYGSLDMAFNNAGIMLAPVDSADETAEAFDKIVAVNPRGVWASMKHELVQMRKQGSGAIGIRFGSWTFPASSTPAGAFISISPRPSLPVHAPRAMGSPSKPWTKHEH